MDPFDRFPPRNATHGRSNRHELSNGNDIDVDFNKGWQWVRPTPGQGRGRNRQQRQSLFSTFDSPAFPRFNRSSSPAIESIFGNISLDSRPVPFSPSYLDDNDQDDHDDHHPSGPENHHHHPRSFPRRRQKAPAAQPPTKIIPLRALETAQTPSIPFTGNMNYVTDTQTGIYLLPVHHRRLFITLPQPNSLVTAPVAGFSALIPLCFRAEDVLQALSLLSSSSSPSRFSLPCYPTDDGYPVWYPDYLKSAKKNKSGGSGNDRMPYRLALVWESGRRVDFTGLGARTLGDYCSVETVRLGEEEERGPVKLDIIATDG